MKPSLENARSTGVAALRLGPAADGPDDPSPSESAAADAQQVSITDDDLVTIDQLAQRRARPLAAGRDRRLARPAS